MLVAGLIAALSAVVPSSSADAALADAASFDELRLPVFQAGATQDVWIVAWNRGDSTWASTGHGGVYLSYHWRSPTGEVVEWDGLRTTFPAPIGPGEPRSLRMSVRAPVAGDYVLEIAMVREGVAWFGSHVARVGVFAETYAAALGPGEVPPGEPGERIAISTYVKNTGSATWSAGGPYPVRLAYHWYDLQGNVLIWDGERTAFDRDVAPGEERTVALSVVLPSQRGLYSLRVEPVREGLFWFSSQSPSIASQHVGVPTGFAAQVREGPADQLRATPGATVDVTFRLRNAGTRTWPAEGPHPVRLSYHLRGDTGIVVWDGARASLPHDVAPGDEVTLTVRIVAPSTARWVYVVYDLVHEGVTWFEAVSPKGPLAIGLLTTH